MITDGKLNDILSQIEIINEQMIESLAQLDDVNRNTLEIIEFIYDLNRNVKNRCKRNLIAPYVPISYNGARFVILDRNTEEFAAEVLLTKENLFHEWGRSVLSHYSSVHVFLNLSPGGDNSAWISGNIRCGLSYERRCKEAQKLEQTLGKEVVAPEGNEHIVVSFYREIKETFTSWDLAKEVVKVVPEMHRLTSIVPKSLVPPRYSLQDVYRQTLKH